MHEHPAVAFELLHDEALAAEQAGEDLALEGDAQRYPARAGQKAVLLADQLAAMLGQAQRQHRARVGCGEGDLGLAAAGVGEHGGEHAFAGDHAFAGRQQLAHQPAATLTGMRAVAEHGVHLHRRVLVHQRTGLGDGAFAGVQLDFDELHVVADDAVVDLICAPAHAGQRRRHATAPLQLGQLTGRRPAIEPVAPGQRIGLALRMRASAGIVEGAETVGLSGVMEIPLGHRTTPVCVCGESKRKRRGGVPCPRSCLQSVVVTRLCARPERFAIAMRSIAGSSCKDTACASCGMGGPYSPTVAQQRAPSRCTRTGPSNTADRLASVSSASRVPSATTLPARSRITRSISGTISSM